MVEPWITSALPGVTNAAGSRVIKEFVKGEDDHTEWKQQVIDMATEAEAARRHCICFSYEPDREGLSNGMEQYGKGMAKLGVIGERRGYPDEEVETVHKLAKILSKCATAAVGQHSAPKKTFLPNCLSYLSRYTNLRYRSTGGVSLSNNDYRILQVFL
ncbi:hypothetical protein NDI54_19865 [Haloarcula sp. S1AR25-5A]|uniref:Uncharacterized protein n=1 Tax=Haloarcula terrestris TaxID=2950533 RepID=A0AAE4F0W5_9EURY|nr:hypothetical protein [Haloarcula terrestris]MDS0223602.1 hypothetical protein [Haloarcula terrestris]